MKLKVVPLLLVILLLAGCAETTGGENDATYRQITMSEAVEMMASESDYIILDVRRPDEFAAGHIPNAINVPSFDQPVIEANETKYTRTVYKFLNF